MTIDKLIVFSETGDKNTEGLDLSRGFPSKMQPARQWHNWLFNKITSKINEIIDTVGDLGRDKVSYIDIVDNLTSEETNKPISANMGRDLEDRKLDKSDLANGDAPVYAVRAWANFSGGTANIRAQGNIARITRTGVGVYEVGFSINMQNANYSVVTAQAGRGDATSLTISGLTVSGFLLQASYGGDNTQGLYDPEFCCFHVVA